MFYKHCYVVVIYNKCFNGILFRNNNKKNITDVLRLNFCDFDV